MKALIIGTGAIGGFVGARLVESGLDVTFLARPQRCADIAKNGLVLASPFGRFRNLVRAITPDEISPIFDLSVIAVRCHDYELTLHLAIQALRPGGIVMPVVEGICHLEAPLSAWPNQKLIGAVFEGRISLDADGVLHQRSPEAELSIGALYPADAAVAADLVKTFAGRGMKTALSSRIAAKSWERFGFLAAGIATAQLMQRPLRDAVRFAFGPSYLSTAIRECWQIGTAAGFKPDFVKMRTYERAFFLEAYPVSTPAMASEKGQAGDEAVYLLGEMVGIARREGIKAPTLEGAWRSLLKKDRVSVFALANDGEQA